MSHTILSILEYALMPFLLIVATVLTKYITKKSNRIKWKEFLSIGLDIILMCSFAMFIYGVSVYNHSSSGEHIIYITLFSFIGSFVLFIFAVLTAVLIRHWGEGSNSAFWFQNIIGGILLIGFLLFVTKTNGSLPVAPPRTTEAHFEKNDTIKQ